MDRRHGCRLRGRVSLCVQHAPARTPGSRAGAPCLRSAAGASRHRSAAPLPAHAGCVVAGPVDDGHGLYIRPLPDLRHGHDRGGPALASSRVDTRATGRAPAFRPGSSADHRGRTAFVSPLSACGARAGSRAQPGECGRVQRHAQGISGSRRTAALFHVERAALPERRGRVFSRRHGPGALARRGRPRMARSNRGCRHDPATHHHADRHWRCRDGVVPRHAHAGVRLALRDLPSVELDSGGGAVRQSVSAGSRTPGGDGRGAACDPRASSAATPLPPRSRSSRW